MNLFGFITIICIVLVIKAVCGSIGIACLTP
ncbi:TPA: DUF3265 domain-containing protein [Vibrio parahaemolyticus]|nr:DUF3265 domain-containing protein [Vibrio parahaemolyticus]